MAAPTLPVSDSERAIRAVAFAWTVGLGHLGAWGGVTLLGPLYAWGPNHLPRVDRAGAGRPLLWDQAVALAGFRVSDSRPNICHG